MTERIPSPLSSAAEDFRRARRRAALQDILARVTGRSRDLLSYEDARQKLKAEGIIPRGLQEIPLDAIVGSVGRYAEFNRNFLPRRHDDEERWARVKVYMAEKGTIRPIQVYQIGQAYFVLDGNHRVSVARELGASHIHAHVTEVLTKVPLSPQDSPDDLILKAEYAGFLERTRLDELHPEADLSVTVPGQYRTIEEQIAVQNHLLAQELGRDPPFENAVTQWYEQVYLPAVEVIRRRGVLRDFPGRTETDLFVWVSRHRAILEQELGWTIRPDDAAEALVEQSSPKPQHVLARFGERIREALTPRELQAGPPTGHWRQEHVAVRQGEGLFCDILVGISGQEAGWRALDEALVIARREGGQLHGLHVVSSRAKRDEEREQILRDEFVRRCRAAGVPGELAIEEGVVSHRITQRARWVDLVVVSLSYPPAPQAIARLSSGLSTLLRSCPRPVLTVPEAWPHLERALLAYDGSPRAQEALFVATYLAGRWGMPLIVTTVLEHSRTTGRTLARARRYLMQQDVPATFVAETGPVAKTVLKVAEEQSCDLIIVGGYGFSPVLEVVLGSAVDEMLRTSRRPMLICR